MAFPYYDFNKYLCNVQLISQIVGDCSHSTKYTQSNRVIIVIFIRFANMFDGKNIICCINNQFEMRFQTESEKKIVHSDLF